MQPGAHNIESRGHSAEPYTWMLVGSFSFAIMGALTHALHGQCAWQVVALVRAALAFVIAAGLVRAARAKFVVFRPPVLWLRSTAGSISLLCTFYALPNLPLADVYTLTNMFPLWVALLAWPVLGERPTWEVWLAVVCGLVGVVLIQQPHFADRNVAAIVALGGSVSTAVAMMGLHRLHEVNSRAVVAHFSAVSTLFCLAALFVFPLEGPRFVEGWWPALLLVNVGLSATLGQLCLTKAFATGRPTLVSVVALSQVGFALLFDVVFEKRRVEGPTALGMALILAPVAWLLVRRSSRLAVAPADPDQTG